MFVLIVLYAGFIAFLSFAYSAGRSKWILNNGARILMVILGLLSLIAAIIQTVFYTLKSIN